MLPGTVATNSTLPSSPDVVPYSSSLDAAGDLMKGRKKAFDRLSLCTDWCANEGKLTLQEFLSQEAKTQVDLASNSHIPSDCPIQANEGDFMAIPVSDFGDQDHGRQATEQNVMPSINNQYKDSFELLLTFTAVVALWGAIDVIVEMIADENLLLELITYIMFAVVAVFAQLACNKLFNANISLMKALDRF